MWKQKPLILTFRGHGKQALLLQACLSANMALLLGQQRGSSVPVSMAGAAEAAGQAGLQMKHVRPQGSHQTTAGCDFGSHCAYGLASLVPDHCLNCSMAFWGVLWIVQKPCNKRLFLIWSSRVSFWCMQTRILPKWVSRFWVLFPGEEKGGDRIRSDAWGVVSVTRAGTDKAETWTVEPDRNIWNPDERSQTSQRGGIWDESPGVLWSEDVTKSPEQRKVDGSMGCRSWEQRQGSPKHPAVAPGESREIRLLWSSHHIMFPLTSRVSSVILPCSSVLQESRTWTFHTQAHSLWLYALLWLLPWSFQRCQSLPLDSKLQEGKTMSALAYHHISSVDHTTDTQFVKLISKKGKNHFYNN